jgi:hypothetical protein
MARSTFQVPLISRTSYALDMLARGHSQGTTERAHMFQAVKRSRPPVGFTGAGIRRVVGIVRTSGGPDAGMERTWRFYRQEWDRNETSTSSNGITCQPAVLVPYPSQHRQQVAGQYSPPEVTLAGRAQFHLQAPSTPALMKVFLTSSLLRFLGRDALAGIPNHLV